MLTRHSLLGLIAFLTVAGATAPRPLGAQLVPTVVASPAVPVAAQDSAGTSPTAEMDADSAQIAAWIDGWMEARLDADDVAGATVSIVRDGRLWFAKGFGFADVAAQRPVEAESTLFRIGSISKLFVWTSVMQLVEQGRLDLHEDVNTYLDTVEVPAAFDRPVTLADLMTHSAGFEDDVLGLFGKDTTALRPLADILNERMPDRIRAPGVVSSYSNHGTAIAMQVVQDVSGEPWAAYIERHILAPLGMSHTTFRQPAPAALADQASIGYAQGGTEAQEYELVPLGPVGAAASTAADMARFMIAHLQWGELDGARILEEATAREMQTTLFQDAPGVNPFLHGFADLSRLGQHIIGHGGDTFWFHSQLSLLPEHDLGVFVSMNTAGSNPGGFVLDLIERLYGTPPRASLRAPADFASRADHFAGVFRSNRFSRTDFTKVAALSDALRVRNEGDTALAVTFGDDRHWVEVAPLLFQSTTSDRVIAFRENEDGRVTDLFLGDVPYLAWERVPRLESQRLHFVLGAFALLVLTLTLVSQPVITWFRYRHQFAPDDGIPGIGRLLGWLAATAYLTLVAGMVVAVRDPNQIALGQVAAVRRILWLGPVGVVLGGLTLTFVVITWASRRGTATARWAFTALGLALAVFTWQLHVWNLLGWQG